MEETVKLKKAKTTRVIPGFKLTMGITVTMLSLIVLIPLASVMVYSLKLLSMICCIPADLTAAGCQFAT